MQQWLSDYSDYEVQRLDRFLELQDVSGRPRLIPDWAVESLQRRLAEPEGFKSYGAVQHWLSELRTRIKQLARRTICFSKTEEMHDLVISLFINRYEFGLPV